MADAFVVNHRDSYRDATFANPETVSNPHAVNKPPIHRKKCGEYHQSSTTEPTHLNMRFD